MALKVTVSTSIEQLFSTLSAQLEAGAQSVFTPHTFVTQTSGMDNWLKYRLAEQSGVAANIRFLRPAGMVAQFYYLTGGSYLKSYLSGNLTWLIYSLLNESDFKDRFSDIAAYYAGKGLDGDLKRLGLARRVTDLFDQYQVYRSDMVKDWNRQITFEVDNKNWQQFLWWRVRQLTAQSIPDKTEMADSIQRQLRQPEQREKLLAQLPAVHFFGISALSPYHMAIFAGASQVMDGHFYLLLPALSQLASGGKTLSFENSLLESWGDLMKETSGIVLQHAGNDGLTVLPQAPKTPATLLQKVQHDLRQNLAEPTQITEADLSDNSLTINACYTATREVESLYNYLVHMVQGRGEAVSTRDIVVLVSQVDTYAPYIKAVFDHAPYKIPYSIEGESLEQSDGLVGALLGLLGISEQSFTSGNVLRLLDSAYIRKRFGIRDLALIRKTIAAANIRFGIDNRSEDDSRFVSWRHGLKRIVYGMCMVGEDLYSDGEETLIPLDDLEGRPALEMVGFLHFVEMLMGSVRERDQARTLSGWVEYTEQVIHHLIWLPDEAANEEYTIVLGQLKRLNAIDHLVKEEMAYELFLDQFSQQLADNTSTHHHGGGVVFCSFIPMRSLPFKMIAMLGLNFDKFPRRDKHLSYDLRSGHHQPGDRSIKNNDKHLFLETVLAAKEKLYISYLGRSTKDNSELPPSSLVEELVDYLESASESPALVRSKLITLQPLHAFSSKYGSGPYYNYIKEPDFRAELGEGNNRNVLNHSSLDLNRLVAFLKNPFKTYYKNVAGINYDDGGMEELEEKELFSLDALQAWHLKNALLEMEASAKADFIQRGTMTGTLPLKNMGRALVDSIDEAVQPLKVLVDGITKGGPASSLAIEVDLGATVLTGQVQHVYADQMVFVCFSSGEFKYYLEAVVCYLAVTAAGHPVQLSFVSAKTGQAFKASPVSQSEAQKLLARLVALFQKGHETIWPFFADFDLKWDEMDRWSVQELHNKIANEFSKFHFPVEEPHILTEYEHGYFEREDFLEAFKANSRFMCDLVLQFFPLTELKR
ncbi:exodeoxyribonuclease V subunit gamma [Geofilum rubicundum]|uniref:RecBCD enzyme subunit RecC n=1 Tax=Geofilum rubicundum JCM 15548 TaxID=1236989 RepID=A0A0E9LYI2_9BACT|nr:exodeoxyribonuclease V subunit gamma [Geofilum rubicundum]GAO30632.1 exodeoxyribonuclease V gamma chain [Geofilum rubicundum JCM 15548]